MAKKEASATTKKVVAKKVTKTTKKVKVTDDEIKARAYEIYVESGYQGSELENWIKAEKELTGRK